MSEKVIDFVEKTLGEETVKSSDIECVIVTEEDGKETGSKAGVADESLGYTSENIERHLQRICEIASCNKRYIKLADNFDTIPSAIKTINDNMLEDLNTIVNVLNYCILPMCKNTFDNKSKESLEKLYISFIETLREKYKEDIANIISVFSSNEIKFKTSKGRVVVKQKDTYTSKLLNESNIPVSISKETAETLLIDSFILSKAFKYQDINFGPGKIIRGIDTSKDIIKLINRNDIIDSFITDNDYLYQFAKSKIPPSLLRDESKSEREIVIDFVKQDVLKKAFGCTK